MASLQVALLEKFGPFLQPKPSGNTADRTRWPEIDLDLSSSSLNGTLPSELGQVEGFDRIFISNNTLSGSIPHHFGFLKRMRELNLDGNGLTGSLSPTLFQMTNLEILSLKNNSIRGIISDEIG